MNSGFIIVGEEPERPPLEELEGLIDELHQYRHELKELRQQEEQILDPKIYIMIDGNFQEVELVKRAIKLAHVKLPCGTKQCLPGKYLEENGKYTRHMKKTDREFYCGWRARMYLLSKIDGTEKWYTKLKKRAIPDLVRSIRESGGTIPKETVLSLAPHYRSVK